MSAMDKKVVEKKSEVPVEKSEPASKARDCKSDYNYEYFIKYGWCRYSQTPDEADAMKSGWKRRRPVAATVIQNPYGFVRYQGGYPLFQAVMNPGFCTSRVPGANASVKHEHTVI